MHTDRKRLICRSPRLVCSVSTSVRIVEIILKRGYFRPAIMIRSLLLVSLLLHGLLTVAQQMVSPEDYVVYEAGMPPRFRNANEPFLLFSKTVPIDRGRTTKIWYQPDVPRQQLRNLRPGKDSLWIWEDSLRTPAWKQLLLRHNLLDMADSLQFDKTLFTGWKAYYWPSDAVVMNQKAIDTVRGTDLRDVARKRESLRLDQEFSPSYHYLSRITYSSDGKKAIFYHAYCCGSRCGSGNLIFLEAVNGEWRSYYTHQIWIS